MRFLLLRKYTHPLCYEFCAGLRSLTCEEPLKLCSCFSTDRERPGVINSHFHRQQHPAQQEARSRATDYRNNSSSFQVKLLKAASFLNRELPPCMNQQWGRHAKSLNLVILVWFQQIRTKTTNAHCVRST